ncbi:MAG: glutathione transferase GstA [Candidatus Caenarcaniphilales bacterium]|nr:glutathione transferase GstA [Candidatus Caenarcaniphilales bacterium]
MKLYYTPGTCSLSPHIVLCEAGYDYDLEKVNLREHTTESGKDYYAINEKGAVPYLELGDGQVLSEGVAIVQYLADNKPESNLIPAVGTIDRAQVQEWLNYITSEVHKAHWPIFRADLVGDQAKEVFIDKVKKAYSYVSDHLADKEYLACDKFTVADAYMFTVLRWHKGVGLDLNKWSVLVEYQKRISERSAVKKVMEFEGISL